MEKPEAVRSVSSSSIPLPTPSASTASTDLKTKIEAMLGQPVNDDTVKALIESLENVFSVEQKLYRNHSFQLVKLQSEAHELRCQRAKDVEMIDRLKSEMQGLFSTMAEMKGKFAQLTIEMHRLRDTSSKSYPIPDRQGHANGKQQTNSNQQHERSNPASEANTNGASASCSTEHGDDQIEALANKFLLEQKPRLIEALKLVQTLPPPKGAQSLATTGALTSLTASVDSAAESTVTNTPINREPIETRFTFNRDEFEAKFPNLLEEWNQRIGAEPTSMSA